MINPFSTIKGYLTGVIIVLALIVVSYALWHYNTLKNQLSVVREQNIALNLSVQTQKQTIDEAIKTINDWEKSQLDYANAVNAMSDNSKSSKIVLRRLNEIFSKHDFAELSLKKPQLIETIINNGTTNSLGLLKCLSSAQYPDCAGRIEETKRTHTP